MTLRILDAGCHDGYIGAYLRHRFGDDVELYGVELHPGAAQKARERGYEAVYEGLFEHCYMDRDFELGSFDIVVLFELIEHVPRPESLLRVAGMMVKPDGRIFVSTPDGCFGAGNNPHHLRAFRAIDLANLLRERGRLLDMGVGEDGVTVSVYTPQRKRGEVAIYTGPGWERWHPMDITTRGLGGSETAAYRVAENLANLGYLVTLYGNCDEGMVREVMVRNWRTFDPTVDRLAVISSRIPEVFDRYVNAEHKLLWLHDVNVGDRLTEERADRIDRILCLSEWHRQHLIGTYPFLRADKWASGPDGSKLYKIRNGLMPAYFTTEPAPEREQRVLYTSSPDRGLDLLLEMWPDVRRLVPDAELMHMYAPVYDKIADRDPGLAEFRDRIRQLSDQPGVRPIGGLSQSKLADLMRSSMVWVHPSYCTRAKAPFHETFCIGAVEAQAAGCVVVCSSWGALCETVATGRLVDGPVGDKWRTAFVENIAMGLTSKVTQQIAQVEGPEYALELGWDGVADMIAALFEPPQREPAAAAVKLAA